ncbi:hypothetical protein KUTeg_024024 [Tegillarca granosa]|uniref:Pirin n=1 Tax=Tegillarca granosa TaxID=220873 RepID=A0ABQ9E2I6_TEGGR|nr:hypothetical protein KUTeg_024024 [Tegillarca granosa]
MVFTRLSFLLFIGCVRLTRSCVADRVTSPFYAAYLHKSQKSFTCSSSQIKMTSSKTVTKQVLSKEQDEGVGARVRRSIGRHELQNLDPFLLLDEFKGKAPAGFPDHPHRGFETVSYLLNGQFRHEDFCGHKGILGPGDLQWMTAGRGIVHCEMPYGDEVSHGLQLWVNLAKKDKMIQPAYQELLDKDIPRTTKDGVTVKVIAGESFGIQMEPGSKLFQPIPTGWTSFIYILAGTAVFGPFVMNTQEEIQQAMVDFRSGKNGFENANKWQSEAAKDLQRLRTR